MSLWPPSPFAWPSRLQLASGQHGFPSDPVRLEPAQPGSWASWAAAQDLGGEAGGDGSQGELGWAQQRPEPGSAPHLLGSHAGQPLPRPQKQILTPQRCQPPAPH